MTAEPLEGRQMLSVTMDDGWTEVTPGSGARVVYASSSRGSDGNSGLSPSSPVKSLAKAKKLLRSGTGDHLLLNRGDTWNESFGFLEASGKNSSEPLVIGAYGSGARPTIAPSSGHALNTSFKGVHDIAIIGVHFDGARRGGKVVDGIVSTGRTSNFLIEDCEIEGFRNNLTFQDFLGPISNVKIRRSAVNDSWSRSTHSQGIYADGVKGITLEENVFDHNGWGNGAGQTPFNHGAYITAKSDGLVAVGNVFSNSSSHGLQARPGGTVKNNAFINNAIGLSYGLVNGGGVVKAGGVTGAVSNNLFTGGHPIGGVPAGVGVEISNIKSATLSDNLFAHGYTTARNPAISLAGIKGTTNAGQAVGINNLTIANNVVYGWSRGLQISSGFRLSNLKVTNNDFQNIYDFQAVANNNSGSQSWSNNRYNVPGNNKTPIIGRSLMASGTQAVKVGYPDAARRVPGDFLAQARKLTKQSWNVKYTAASVVSFLKGGFTGKSIPTISTRDLAEPRMTDVPVTIDEEPGEAPVISRPSPSPSPSPVSVDTDVSYVGETLVS